MAVQVALEVEVGQHVRVRNAQQSLQLRVGLDGVLVLQVLLLHVGRNGLGDVGAALLRARGAAEERAQLIGEGRRELEDGRLAGHNGLALDRLLLLTLALVSLLLQTGHTLLQTLQLGNKGANRLANRVGLGEHGLHVVLDRGDAGVTALHGGRLHGGYRGYRGRNYGGSYRGRRLLGGKLGLGGRGRGLRRNYGGSHNGRRGRGGRLLRNRLLGGRSRGVHYTGGRGSIHGGNTHIS